MQCLEVSGAVRPVRPIYGSLGVKRLIVSTVSWLVPVSARSKTQLCNLLVAGIAGSNPAECMDVRRLCLLCVVYVVASATS